MTTKTQLVLTMEQLILLRKEFPLLALKHGIAEKMLSSNQLSISLDMAFDLGLSLEESLFIMGYLGLFKELKSVALLAASRARLYAKEFQKKSDTIFRNVTSHPQFIWYPAGELYESCAKVCMSIVAANTAEEAALHASLASSYRGNPHQIDLDPVFVSARYALCCAIRAASPDVYSLNDNPDEIKGLAADSERDLQRSNILALTARTIK